MALARFIVLSVWFVGFSIAHGQDDLLSLLGEEEPTINYTSATFKTTRIINGHSIENTAPGVLDIKILHRFGFVNGGFYELFGLDNASVRIGGEFGISERLMIGVGRSSFEKVYDGYFKYKVLRQSSGARNMPVSVSWFSSAAIKTIDFQEPERENFFSSRLYYVHQVLIARKFSDRFSFQVTPSLVHRNLVETSEEANDVFSVGLGGRYKLNNRFSINAEYFYVPEGQIKERFHPSFSVGVDIETGGHVFQLHFTNSTSMIEKGFIAETVGDWTDGGVHFGFNISRVFTIVKPEID